MSLGLFDHPSLTEHRTGALHPERPARVIAVREGLQDLPLQAREAPLVSRELIARVHTPQVIAALQASAGGPSRHLDPDTVISARSWEAALASAGGAVQACEDVLSARLDSAFVIARPPGHHAESDRPMGFCLLNNVAIAAMAALDRVKRVAILDWDVHHGNGTQAIFYSDPRVLYVSLHRFPFYPGTGAANESGSGAGTGTTLNLPLPEGCSDALWGSAFEQLALPAIDAFAPELVLVSAGFDAHTDDPLGGMRLTAASYARMSRALVELCARRSRPKPVLVLEGGYSLQGLAESAQACARELLGDDATLPSLEALSAYELRVLAALRSRERESPRE